MINGSTLCGVEKREVGLLGSNERRFGKQYGRSLMESAKEKHVVWLIGRVSEKNRSSYRHKAALIKVVDRVLGHRNCRTLCVDSSSNGGVAPQHNPKVSVGDDGESLNEASHQ